MKEISRANAVKRFNSLSSIEKLTRPAPPAEKCYGLKRSKSFSNMLIMDSIRRDEILLVWKDGSNTKLTQESNEVTNADDCAVGEVINRKLALLMIL